MKSDFQQQKKQLARTCDIIENWTKYLHDYSQANNGAIFPEIGMIESAINSIRYKELRQITK